MQLIVTAEKLNKRNSVPVSFTDNNIVGVVLQGFRFEGEEVATVPDTVTGKWYKDGNDSFYWGGGLSVENNNIAPMPAVSFRNIIQSGNGKLIMNLPPGFILGTDVSHHNGDADWKAIVNAGNRFAFIKITEGVGTPDAMAKANAQNARNIGLKIGYYHFCHPDTKTGGTVADDANAEADEALKRISANLLPPDLPLVMDLEDEAGWDSPLNKHDYLTWIQTFIDRVKNSTGHQPMIYSRKDYLDGKLPADHHLGIYKLWLANYSQTDCTKLACPAGWNDWAIWQFSESASIGGNPKLDLNILKDTTLI
jgi:GH25 family lysozyme M1 (1,4-beta-N-acetylmuramidase)